MVAGHRGALRRPRDAGRVRASTRCSGRPHPQRYCMRSTRRPGPPLADMDDAPPPVAMQLIGDDFGETFGGGLIPNRPLPGWHAHKWSGIALAPNGKLYCSPFSASKVLRIDPATDTTELIGDVLEPSGNIRWSGIAAAADGKLYCSPNSASRVQRIDPATDTPELIGDALSAHGEGSPPIGLVSRQPRMASSTARLGRPHACCASTQPPVRPS